MRYYGTIIRWNESRKFGAIREESSDNEIFAPLAAFNGMPEAPFEGLRVSFNLIKGRKGRDEAQDIRVADEFDEFEGLSADTEPLRRRPSAPSSRTGGIVLAALLGVALISGGAWYGWQKWQQYQAEAVKAAQNPVSMVEEVAAQMKEERKAWKDAVKSSSSKPASVRQFSTVSPSATNTKNTEQKFSCDGRQYCSQMTSREEAEFFITHCADTKMDSDHDGEPCEHDSRW